ncbi:MAG: tRNA (guanosine(37)-N1)-methyltransferase TrmD [Candidatus Hydrogenedens sp.]|jgi:tRNA (guanine37-N1)-methyltransferase|nr:tRNA (guanosine(37)-N1)-methyltransferase TrmD [Candidatus Hydrogenedens sp.]
MRIDILTLFPEIFEAALKIGVLGRAIAKGILQVNLVNPRDFTHDRHRTVDDAPYGGGAGMVMTCPPVFEAVESLINQNSLEHVVLLSPRGRRLDQERVREMAGWKDMVLLCARYEGMDERISQTLVTDEVSIGDYVLSGGEAAALVVVEAVSRMAPGVVGNWESVDTDSFYHGILGYPQYTRPPVFRGKEVPPVLLEGNHEAIRIYRRREALRATWLRRPDLLQNLSKEDLKLLAEIGAEIPPSHKENSS